MPLYDYRCGACGAEFETLVRGRERVVCPGCEAADVERLLSRPARPVTGSRGGPDLSKLGPPSGGCCGGSCHSHQH